MPVGVYSCLVLGGALTATQPALSDVGQTLEQDINMLVVDATRLAATTEQDFDYFIKVNGDLNSRVTYVSAGTGDLNDDAYGFSEFNCAKTDTASFNSMLLPTSEGDKTVSAGLINAKNLVTGSAVLLGTFQIDLTVSASSQGILTASIAVAGTSRTGSVVDTNLKAQAVYWNLPGATAPIPTAISADSLSATITAENIAINSTILGQLNTVKNFYNGHEMLSAWNIKLNAFDAVNTNVLSKHARSLALTSPFTPVFSAGAMVVAGTPFSYSVIIKDHLGADQTIVAAKNVYGVVVQTA